MKKRKSSHTVNPLLRRIPRELTGDWRKYLVVSLFLILAIGFVSGIYVANESMLAAAENSITKYKREDGHFELSEKADGKLLKAIASCEKADIKAFYTEKAKDKLDEKFADEFRAEFTKEFDAGFSGKFEEMFAMQIKNALASQGLGEEAIAAALPAAITKAKEDGQYKAAYEKAYGEAYADAYDEAYGTAYGKAWDKISREIDEKYAEAVEAYKLSDPDFRPVPVKLHENFFKNEEEDNDLDGEADGTVRVFVKNDGVNLACVMDGRLPENADEIAIDRMHADNVSVNVGDSIRVGKNSFRVVGLIAYVNYSTLHEKNTDMIFDALKFNVAMVTEDGFDLLDADVRYNYAWQYEDGAASAVEEKKLSDNFLSALLTQTVVSENEITEYLPSYANQAINFAAGDMGGDMAMGGVILDVLIIIIAFIFAVTISNTIAKESKTIGTLRASGYTKGELMLHYLTVTIIVTLVSAVVGNLLGYTLFKNVVVSMYYNSYSLPTYETVWNTDAFVKTTLVPLMLMFGVNLVMIAVKMQHTPLQFLRCDLKKGGRKRAIHLPDLGFFGRFRLRVIFQNIPNYIILFFGIFFVSVMQAMTVGMPETLEFYKQNAGDMMFSKYQYVLRSYKDGDGTIVTTGNTYAERFCMTALERRSDSFSEEISVYGIMPQSRYVDISDMQRLGGNEVYISSSFRDKFGVSVGDTITLDEKYENRSYSFKVKGFYDKSIGISVFMPIESFRKVFDLDNDAFSGYMSDFELSDLPEGSVATVITERDITKMTDQLDHSMGAYMQYFQVLCILLSAVMIYLLSKIIIEKNENAISMTKILGYENREIASLYLTSTTAILIISDAVCTALGSLAMSKLWESMLADYSGWYTFQISPFGYIKMFLFVLIGYIIVMGFDFKRIKKIPMDEALKNAE